MSNPPSYPEPAQPPFAPPQPQPQGHGLATASLVLGIVGAVLCWLPIIGVAGGILGVLAIALGAIGIVKAIKPNGTGKGLAIAGTALGVVGLLGAILAGVVFTKAVDDAVSTLGSATAAGKQAADTTDAASKDAESAEEPAESFKDNVLTLKDCTITITDYKVIPVGEEGNEYGDKPVIAFWYDITNISSDSLSPMEWIYDFTAIQDNNPNAVNELDVASLPDDRFLESQTENIKIGGTVSNAVAYELDDETTPVTLQARSSLIGDPIGEQTFPLK